ncbi:alpha-N-acetylglucosaminidase [Allokutzneria albata]|uniref:Alpha-N-acetylglucosaminidase (NAGLU) N-terminal domain-containing protein n=1 Tax=Allokutzneria albata TaxID=211114 RepID=A0A1G9Z8Q4_ALLAB|nr:alpha-N-acetylglucosaminidase [Allokutzneria albata]SDN17938.1 Alpha-N-acetylglucosaminidase (NAGLU) N-terminal domain-containing protein [Allokutzneria albata]
MTRFHRRGFLQTALAGALVAAAPGTASAESPRPPRTFDTAALRTAITRLLGGNTGWAQQFDLRPMEPPAGAYDVFDIAGERGAVELSASSPVALMSGFHWWLKYVAGGHLSANGDRLDLPRRLPAPKRPITKTTSLTDRYAYNFTVFGYTMPYWHWEDWERELDLLAASGYNRVLSMVGQEIIWYELFQNFGLTEYEVRQWIAQPAHQPWQWYGEITGYDDGESAYSGPVSVELMRKRADLGRRINERMWQLGITPVLPAFIGHVPDRVFAQRNPFAKVIPQEDYGGHPRPWWLAATDPLWPQVAEQFYRLQAKHFGTSTHYSNDLMHEGGVLGDVKIGDAGRAVQNALTKAVPNATWLLQAWQGNPRKELIESIDRNRVIVLDLDSDDGPLWNKTNAFWGAPWAWGTIQNFGGRLGMFGNLIEPGRTLPAVRKAPDRGRLTGTAMVLEGTYHNPVVGDLLAEMTWRDEPVELEGWIADYVRRRYGTADQNALTAWRVLLNTAYSYKATGHTSGEGPHETPFAAEPALTVTSASSFAPKTWRYPPEQFEPALAALLRVHPMLRQLKTYRYDLVDVTRQVLANRARRVLDRVRTAYQAKNRLEVERLGERFLHYADLTDRVLGTHEQWMLGPWEQRAKGWAATPLEEEILVWNARSILTIWTIKGCGVFHEYANRDWHGLMGQYYRARWQRWFTELAKTVDLGIPPVFNDWCSRADNWARRAATHPTKPLGDTYTIAAGIAAELAGEKD